MKLVIEGSGIKIKRLFKELKFRAKNDNLKMSLLENKKGEAVLPPPELKVSENSLNPPKPKGRPKKVKK